MKARSRGFTIVEVLVALAILGVILATVIVPLTRFYVYNSQSSKALDLNARVQQVMDRARGLLTANYTTPATALSSANLPLPSNVTLTCQNIDVFGNAMSSPACTDLAAGVTPPPGRQIAVTGTQPGKPDIVLVLDVSP